MSAVFVLVWIITGFVPLEWSNGHRKLVRLQSGTCLLVSENWAPGSRRAGLRVVPREEMRQSTSSLSYLRPRFRSELGSLWTNIPIWIPVLISLCILVAIETRNLLWMQRMRCSKCGYSLKHIESVQCPECGAEQHGGSWATYMLLYKRTVSAALLGIAAFAISMFI